MASDEKFHAPPLCISKSWTISCVQFLCPYYRLVELYSHLMLKMFSFFPWKIIQVWAMHRRWLPTRHACMFMRTHQYLHTHIHTRTVYTDVHTTPPQFCLCSLELSPAPFLECCKDSAELCECSVLWWQEHSYLAVITHSAWMHGFLMSLEVAETRCFGERDVILMQFRGAYGKRKSLWQLLTWKARSCFNS